MNNILRNVLIAILIVVALWLVLVLVDCIRLKNSEYYTEPLIKVTQEITEDKVAYTGLGYTVTYIQEKEVTHVGSDYRAVAIGAEGAEFRLFGKLLIWAYIE